MAARVQNMITRVDFYYKYPLGAMSVCPLHNIVSFDHLKFKL